MFALGRRTSGSGVADIDGKLRAMICDPRLPTIPLLLDMNNVGVRYSEPFSSLERFYAQGQMPATVPMMLIETWVRSYVQRKRWDLAWLLVRLMYMGSLEPVDMNMFQWQGVPGASRLWVWRDGVLLPTLMVGPVKTILGNWFGLSGGLFAPGGMPMDAPVEEFLDDWVSPNSPLVLDPPERGVNAYDVLDMVGESFHDQSGYPKATLEELHWKVEEIPDTSIKDGVVFVRETPLVRVHPAPWERKLIPTKSAWGLEWLEEQRVRVPNPLFLQALTLREGGC